MDIWTLNEIARLTDRLEAADQFRGPPPIAPSWVNGNAYVQAKETFGILPMGNQTRNALGMQPYSLQLAKDLKMRHSYLAACQNTAYAILPVHTHEERSLFHLLVTAPGGQFTGLREPNWQAVAAKWAEHGDGKKIFYKVCVSLFNAKDLV